MASGFDRLDVTKIISGVHCYVQGATRLNAMGSPCVDRSNSGNILALTGQNGFVSHE